MVRRIINRWTLVVLVALIVLPYGAFATTRWSVRAGVGPIAHMQVEIGNKAFPKQVTAHALLTKWDAVHGTEPLSDPDDLVRCTTETCVQEELPQKFWYGMLSEEEQASLREAVIQLNVEGKPKIPKIELPKVDLSGFKLFSSK